MANPVEASPQIDERPHDRFWPEAMLPAYFVTDKNLTIVNCNDFARDLLRTFAKDALIDGRSLSVRLRGQPNNCESLWECILDQNASTNIDYVKAALNVLEEHLTIIDRFNKSIPPISIEVLIDELNSIQTKLKGTTPYVYSPKPDTQIFRMGVKVSPPQGIKLIRRAKIENAEVEYIDIVMAYRLINQWSGDNLTRVDFVGVQPAIHDATERHHLWVRTEVEKRSQITTFLSHAFQTPISNIRAMVGELRKAPLTDYYRKRFEKLAAHIDDLGHLSELIVFISTSAPVPTIFCKSTPRDANIWEYVTVDEIKNEIVKTIQSIKSGRTRDKQNEKKVELLIGENYTRQSTTDSEARPISDSSKIVGSILELREIEEQASFGLLLPEDNSWDVAVRAKTTFLNLLLVELLLNAIKCADAQLPEVKMVIELNDIKDRLNISIINNGLELKESEFHNVDELAEKPGEKRKALGLKLNIIAAEKLGWKLEWKTPAQKGTHLILSIPYRE